MIKPQTLKGFRDFLPQNVIKRQFIIDKIKKVFELYGFDPLETPALEYAETLLGKYGNEADKLLYLFKDRGGRNVGMRYDQTVPLARVIAQYKNEISFPFKRYQIQPVWRAENPQRGRFREFMQCDIDTVGIGGIRADTEIIACVIASIKKLGFKRAKMIVNDRTVFVHLQPKYVAAIDKLKKIGKEGVIAELISKGYDKNDAGKLINSFDAKKPTPHIISLFQLLREYGLEENKDYLFDPTLARGLDYYTSTIFELVADDYLSGSLGGGGRYDKLIGKFIGEDIPAVGFSFGFDRLLEAMDQLQLLPQLKSLTKVLVSVFSPEFLNISLKTVSLLRDAGINTEIVFDTNIKLDKQLKYADKKGIPYAAIIGPDEA
ncbi:histidine--tRNA ligase, partial [Candidatus Gottesmanbacteria bacterium]|nr:histidine--tRNA ligase [Candidatus Gottesmanbacteria bacterium]